MCWIVQLQKLWISVTCSPLKKKSCPFNNHDHAPNLSLNLLKKIILILQHVKMVGDVENHLEEIHHHFCWCINQEIYVGESPFETTKSKFWNVKFIEEKENHSHHWKWCFPHPFEQKSTYSFYQKKNINILPTLWNTFTNESTSLPQFHYIQMEQKFSSKF